GLQLGEQHGDPPNIAGPKRFGDDDGVQVVSCAGDDYDDVVVAPLGVQAVDPDRPNRATPVQFGETRDRLGAGRFLVGGRGGVFQVEEDQVGLRCGGLGEHVVIGRGHCKFRAAQQRGHLPGSSHSTPRVCRSSMSPPASPSSSPYTSALCSPIRGPRCCTRPVAAEKRGTGAWTVIAPSSSSPTLTKTSRCESCSSATRSVMS